MAESDYGRAIDSYLTRADQEMINALTFNSSLRPSFEVIKSCLIWDDERPRALSKEGRRFIDRLLVMRSFLHQGIPRDRWRVDPTPFESAWRAAEDAQLKWPGFSRLYLSEEDRLYFQRSLDEASKNGKY